MSWEARRRMRESGSSDSGDSGSGGGSGGSSGTDFSAPSGSFSGPSTGDALRQIREVDSDLETEVDTPDVDGETTQDWEARREFREVDADLQDDVDVPDVDVGTTQDWEARREFREVDADLETEVDTPTVGTSPAMDRRRVREAAQPDPVRLGAASAFDPTAEAGIDQVDVDRTQHPDLFEDAAADLGVQEDDVRFADRDGELVAFADPDAVDDEMREAAAEQVGVPSGEVLFRDDELLLTPSGQRRAELEAREEAAEQAEGLEWYDFDAEVQEGGAVDLDFAPADTRLEQLAGEQIAEEQGLEPDAVDVTADDGEITDVDVQTPVDQALPGWAQRASDWLDPHVEQWDEGGMTPEEQAELQRSTPGVPSFAEGIDESVAAGAQDITNIPAIAQSAVVQAGLADRSIRDTREETGDPRLAGQAMAQQPGEEWQDATEFQGEQLAEQVDEDPVRVGAAVVGGAVFGTGVATGAARGIEGGAARTRRTVRERRADAVVDFEDITGPRVQTGEVDLPHFRTDPGEPTPAATAEVRQRAADQPDELVGALPGDRDRALFRTDDDPLPGDLTVQRGDYELPGLFTSPDVSPLRLAESPDGRTGGFRLGLPRVRDPGDQVTIFPGDRIEGMPDRAAGAGRSTPTPAERGTPGAQFLDHEAERGTAYVRPRGDRTTELEAIFPPGSEFVEGETRLAIRTPEGRAIPGRVFERGDQPDAPGAAGAGERVFGIDDVPTSQLTPQEDVVTPAPAPAGDPTSTTRPDADVDDVSAPVDTDLDRESPGVEASEPVSATVGVTEALFGSGSDPDAVSDAPATTSFGPADPGASSVPTADEPSEVPGASVFGVGPSPVTPGPSTPTQPVGEPTGVPSTPATPGLFGPIETTPAQTRPRGRADDDDERDLSADEPRDPETPGFWNPIATGTEDLFGSSTPADFGEGVGAESPEMDAAENLFGGDDAGPFGAW